MNYNKDLPLITIGMCCYNSEDTVGRAIDSALAQDYSNFELLIIDDGSQDGTETVIAEKIKNHLNARLIIHDKNKGFPGALNTVIDQAKGEFIAIFDDDDTSMPERIRIQQKHITEYEIKTKAKLVTCWGSGIRKYPNGYDVKFDAIGCQPENPIGTTVMDYILYFGKKDGIFYGNGTPSCSLMTRKSTYDHVGLYDTNMFRSEDADFSCRFALKGGHFIGCTEKVVTQYSTGGPEKKATVMHDSYQKVIEKYKDYLINKNRYRYACLWNKLRLHHFDQNLVKAINTLMQLFFYHPVLTWNHLWASAPKRIIHEWKMKRNSHISEL